MVVGEVDSLGLARRTLNRVAQAAKNLPHHCRFKARTTLRTAPMTAAASSVVSSG